MSIRPLPLLASLALGLAATPSWTHAILISSNPAEGAKLAD